MDTAEEAGPIFGPPGTADAVRRASRAIVALSTVNDNPLGTASAIIMVPLSRYRDAVKAGDTTVLPAQVLGQLLISLSAWVQAVYGPGVWHELLSTLMAREVLSMLHADEDEAMPEALLDDLAPPVN